MQKQLEALGVQTVYSAVYPADTTNLQTIANGICRQPEGLAIDGDGNLYAASNSDTATTVG